MSSGPFCFHLSQGGNATGIGDMYRAIMGEGRTPYGMIANDIGRAQEVIDYGGEVAFRWTGPEFEYLDYNLSPSEAAGAHMAIVLNRIALSPDFNKEFWLITVNEPDKNRSEWLGQTCAYIGSLMFQKGLKWLAPGWSGGEPETWQWEGWQTYLQNCAAYPERLGIALHEYTFDINDHVATASPHLIGRFQRLHEFCDSYGIARPTIWITEWGWELNHVPSPADAIAQIEWAYSNIYSKYPNVKVIAIWYLGSGFAGIANEAVKIMPYLQNWLVDRDFGPEPPPAPKPEKMRVRLGPLRIRTGADTGQQITGSLKMGSEITPTEIVVIGNDLWARHEGYSAIRYRGRTYLESIVPSDNDPNER